MGLFLFLLSKYLVYFNYGKAHYRDEHLVRSYGLFFLRCFYLPSCLAVSRLYYCENNGRLSADPSVICWSGVHLPIAIVCLFLSLPFFIGLPILFYSFVSDSIIYDREYDHERRLQCWEIAHIFQLSDYFQRSQLWLCSSFRRQSAYLTVGMLGFKACSLILFLLFRFSPSLQAALFWFLVLFSLSFALIQQPYRMRSTNSLLVILTALLFINATFGLFNAFRVQNSAMVASTETVMLLAFNAFGLALSLAVLLVGILGHARWPTQRTLYRLRNSSLWSSVEKWIETIREAQAIDIDCYKCIPEAVDILSLERSIRSLRKTWFSASSVGSIFSVLIRENIEQLLLTHTAFLPFALRRFEYLDKAWIEGGGEAFARREHTYKLSSPLKKRIITKLLALKAFVGNRVVNREMDLEFQAPPDTDEYGMDMAKHRRLAALLLNDGKDIEVKPVQRTIQDISAEKELKRQKMIFWNSPEEYSQTKVILADLSVRSENLLQRFKQIVNQNESILSSSVENLVSSELFSELFHAWNDVIDRFDRRELGGGGLFHSVDEEEWITYRFTLRERWRDYEIMKSELLEVEEREKERVAELEPEVEESLAADSQTALPLEIDLEQQIHETISPQVVEASPLE